MVKVRTTFQPTEELDVDPSEAESLRNQGLLVQEEVEDSKEETPAKPETKPAKTK